MAKRLTSEQKQEIYLNNPWHWRGQPFTTDDVDDWYGFVYCITFLPTNQKYIGRKYFWTHRKPKGKSRRVRALSDWQTYYGSSAVVQSLLKSNGPEQFRREILSLHKDKGDCNYTETKTLFEHNVLEEFDAQGQPLFFNDNILGRYMRRTQYYDKEVMNEWREFAL